MKTIQKILLLALTTVVFVACNKFNDPKPFPPTTDADVGKIISIAELKRSLWGLHNFLTEIRVTTTIPYPGEIVTAYEQTAWASWIVEDVYIKGRVISDDREGNFFRQLFIQDEGRDGYPPTGIVVKIGRSGLYNFYKPGQIVYVRCKDLVLGYYRGMYEIGYFPDRETYYPTSFIDIPTLIERHILAGSPHVDSLKLVEPKPVTVKDITRNVGFDNSYSNAEINFDSLKNDMLMGTLIRIVNVRHDSTDHFLGNLYPRYQLPNGTFIQGSRNRRTGIEIAPELKAKDYITTWALPARLVRGLEPYITFWLGNRFDNNQVFKSYDDDPLVVPSTMALTVSHFYSEGVVGSGNPLVVRTSGYARFAGMPVQTHRDFVGIIGVYTDRQIRTGNKIYYPAYQLTIRSLDDVTPPKP